jgi:general secretion pathway protein D
VAAGAVAFAIHPPIPPMARSTHATLLVGLVACTMMFAHADEEGPQVSPAEALNRRKLERIIIPKLEFRDATLREAIDFLKKKCVELDTDSPSGERGLNIVLKLEAADRGGGDASPAIPGIPGRGAAGPAWKNPAEARITLSLANISLLEALRYVTGMANLKLKIDPDRVYIVPLEALPGTIITKEWKIPRDLIPGFPPDPANENAASGEPKKYNVDREIAKNWLVANGVTFNGPASAVYIVKSSRLIVRNTQDQVDLVDTIISADAAGTPSLVEIECRLVQIEREKIKTVSFDEITKVFNSPPKESGQSMLRDAGGIPSLTPSALEALIRPSPNSDPVAGFFTDPQFQLVLRALVQKKGVELMTAPRITVKSGGAVVIRFVRQYSNPTADVPPQVQSLVPAANASTAAAGKKALATSPVSSREGNFTVTLKVEPVVGPDGYTIDLNMTPQVTESDDFVSFMSPFRWMNPAFGPAGRIVTPQFAPTAVFSTRKVTTSVSVFDCSTVMFGDLFGRVTDGPPDKRHLMLFVTAALKNASSGPVGADKEEEEVITIDPNKTPEKELPLMPR